MLAKKLGCWFLLIASMLCTQLSYSDFEVNEFANDQDRLRYMKFIEELRCPKCKNQNLAGSNSPIAQDLRSQLLRLIEQGKNNDEIIDYMVERYGDFVLYRPRIQPKTYLLWLGPLLMVGLGLTVLGLVVFKRKKLMPAEQAALSSEEQSKIDALINKSRER